MTVSVEALFRDVFLPLYPEDAKSDLGRARTEDANPANNPSVLGHLDDAARVFVGMAESALGLHSVGGLGLDYTDASVHRLSAALTRERRDRLMSSSSSSSQGAKGTSDNALFNVVVHGAAYVGACIVRSHQGVWSVRRPLWESVVRLKSRAGEADLPVFHWWLKALADPAGEEEEGVTPTASATLADRYRAYVEVPCARVEDLSIIAPPSLPAGAMPGVAPAGRDLPKLTKVRYDVFYKYLKAHLPEIRDVGEAFPSPERFAELELQYVSFTLVGGGRMLLIHGPNKHGLHAFWLTKEGFEKSAFWPSDSFPAPILRVKDGASGDVLDQKIEVILSRNESPATFELLWWGP